MIGTLSCYELDFQLCDSTGNTAIHMVCDGLKEYANDDWNEREPYTYAIRAAGSIGALATRARVSCQARNRQGVSGFDAVRQRLEYEGNNAFWTEVADCWKVILVLERQSIELVDGVQDVLKAKYPDLDMSWLTQCCSFRSSRIDWLPQSVCGLAWA